jgi:ABC-2 type transport system ATP-binding protein
MTLIGVYKKMTVNSEFILQTDNLTKSFGDVHALKSLNMNVKKNSIFGFLGPNGAGKTTAMKMFLGLIHPTSGTATIFGNDIKKDSIAVRAKTGYLAQEHCFYKNLTAREILNYTFRFYFKGDKATVSKRIDEMLELVKLDDKADRPIKGFSGGEMQRLGIAQAEINYPDLIILDEPAASLDPLGRRDVLEVMEQLREYTTVVYSTHILDDVQKVSDTVAILNHGHLIVQGSIDEILASSENIIYQVEVKGQYDDTIQNLKKLDWITNLSETAKNSHHILNISVTDEKLAEQELLREILSNKKVDVASFTQKHYDLEEIFMNLVEGEEVKENGI